MTERTTINVYESDSDMFYIPDEIYESTRWTKRGYPDKRLKRSKKAQEWIASVDKRFNAVWKSAQSSF